MLVNTTSIYEMNADVETPAFIIDGMNADFQIHAHVLLRDDALRAGPVVIRMLAVEHLVERHHVEEIHFIEEFLVYIVLEITDFAHDAVGVKQLSLG